MHVFLTDFNWSILIQNKFSNYRQQIRPNTGFFRQLIAYEKSLYGTTSVSMVYKESLGQEIPDVYEQEYHAMEVFYQKHRHLKLR